MSTDTKNTIRQGADMNEQDTKAFEDWSNKPHRNATGESISCGLLTNADFVGIEGAWQAACEYKDKQYASLSDKCNSYIVDNARLTEQLAAKDAVIAQMWEALKDATETIEFTSGTDMSCDPKEDCSDYWRLLNAHNDDSALQEVIKQAKRDAGTCCR